MKRLIIVLVLLALLPGAAQAGMKVRSENLEDFDPSAYSSYCWKAADPATSGLVLAEGAMMAKKLEEIGDRTLAKAGLEKKPAGEAELIMRYRGFSRDKVGVGAGAGDFASDTTWLVGYGPPPTVYKEGTVLIEAIDPESEELLWAGWATDALEAFPRRDTVIKKVEKAAVKIMKKFPK